jgi:hypothetical protein
LKKSLKKIESFSQNITFYRENHYQSINQGLGSFVFFPFNFNILVSQLFVVVFL